MKGLKVGAVKARFEQIELDFGLVVESFEVSGQEADCTADPFHIRLSQPGKARAVVTEGAVAQLLAAKAPNSIKDFQVQISDGLIYVEAKAQIVVTIPVKAACSLEIQEGKRLIVRIESVDVMGGAAKNLVESQIAKINPIFDASDLPIDIRLDTVDADAGKIVVDGTVLAI